MRDFLHRQIWRRLPRGLRRAGLQYATLAMAPRPTARAALQAPFFVCGPLSMATGLGEGARLCHDALKACGLEVHGIDLSLSHLDKGGPVPQNYTDGRRHTGGGTAIVHVNAPYMALALTRLGRPFITGKRIVGAWAWELPVAPTAWASGAAFAHEIWASSAFTAAALGPIARNLPIKAVGYPAALRAPTMPPLPRAADSLFRVFTMFDMSSSFSRKNGLGAVAAFRDAFGPDPTAELVIKTARTGHFPDGLAALQAAGQGLNLRIIDADLPRADIDALFDASDVVLSLHRAEGFGLLAAEGMLRAKPVVATDFSATTELITPATGYPVPWTPVPAADPQGVYDVAGATWAEPDIAAAAQTLRLLRDNPELGRRLGLVAFAHAQTLLSARAYCERAGLGTFMDTSG